MACRSPGKPPGKKPAPKKVAASPPPKAKVKKEPAPLEPLDKRGRERRNGRIEAKLDLHGMTQDEAHEALRHFIDRARSNGKRHLAIITGKGSRGEGVLRRAVPCWLELPDIRPHISAIASAAPEKGGEGVLLVWLKKG